jgi:phage shock protein C
MEVKKTLYKSTTDRRVWGVCGGLAEYFDVDAALVRLLFVVFTLMGGPGLIVYIVLALVLPEAGGRPSDFDFINKRKNDEY